MPWNGFPSRRTAVGVLAAFGLAGSSPAKRAMRHPKIEGLTTWSESVMVLYFDGNLENGFSLRLSRYPALETSWLWCHVLFDGHLYAYTDQFLPSSTEQIGPDQDVTSYSVPRMQARMARSGTSADLKRLSFSVQLLAHRDRSGIDGPGSVPVKLDGIFYPGALRANSPAGRFERSGRVEADLIVGDKEKSFSGVAKAHEQTQTNPRFGPSFTYAMLWGEQASMTGLFAQNRAYGDFETSGDDRPIREFLIEKWSPNRKFAVVLSDGKRIEGLARTTRSLDVPVFDRMWHGHIVSAEAGGYHMVGMINDWKPEDQKYAIAI